MWLRLPRDGRSIRALGKIRTLSRGDWTDVAIASALLPAFALALRIIPLRRLLALLRALPASETPGLSPRGAARSAALVEALAARLRPRPGCLTQALVVFALLRRRGLAVGLVIGVRTTQDALLAHAWVRHGHEILLGRDSAAYAPLLLVGDRGGVATIAGSGALGP